MGRAPFKLTTLRTGDPVQDRWQEHVKQTLDPVLSNPFLAAADFQLIEVASADPTKAPTFALQYRAPAAQTTGQAATWTTILSVSSAGVISTATIAGSQVTGQITQPSWTAATFANSWVDLGAPSPATAYFKDSLGQVHVRIYVKTGTVNTAFFNLPAGFRPASELNPCLVWSGGVGAQPLTVKANGDVGFIGVGNTAIFAECIFDTR